MLLDPYVLSFLFLDVNALHLSDIIFSFELVSNIVSCPFTNRFINKLTGSIYYDKIEISEALCSMSEFVEFFGFGS